MLAGGNGHTWPRLVEPVRNLFAESGQAHSVDGLAQHIPGYVLGLVGKGLGERAVAVLGATIAAVGIRVFPGVRSARSARWRLPHDRAAGTVVVPAESVEQAPKEPPDSSGTG